MSDIKLGARWWRESLALGRVAPGALGSIGLVGGAALALGGCYQDEVRRPDPAAQSQSAAELDGKVDALALQRAEGWNAGVERPLLFPNSTVDDVAHTQSWRAAMEPLAATLAPPEPYLPYYVPTLFQSLMGPAGQGLRAVMRPIDTPEMSDDFQRGLALRQQFAAVDWPRDTAIVVDAPGPRAVALAAALADRFAPVFTFANWPHPLGVVPAHQTLAAVLYYRPAFEAAQAARAVDAPPLFVLDANRLAPYRDADNEFDNRYFVSLPVGGVAAHARHQARALRQRRRPAGARRSQRSAARHPAGGSRRAHGGAGRLRARRRSAGRRRRRGRYRRYRR